MKFKESDNWSSPDWILRMFKGWYDPCPLNECFELDGLRTDWLDKTYVNPPYSNPKPWIQKAIEENKKGKMIAMLLPVDTSTEWYKMLVDAQANILFINGRLKFSVSKKPARWACMLVILQ